MSLPPNLVRQLGTIMLQWSPLWLATTAVTTALGFAYVAFYKEDVWVASQALIVRDEIGGTLNRQGRFDNKESLKAALDTILEIARNPQVVQQALVTQLPSDAEPLTEKDINGFIGNQLTVRSPKGSEFGTTEIFYVDVRHNDKQQAVELNKAICVSLEKRLQDIRMSRYDGIERELEYALDIAKEQRTIATEQLKKIENDVGDNLTDLRSLTDSPSAGGTAKLQLDQLTGERRQVEVLHRQLQEDLRFLQALENDPSRVLVAPSNILNSQPGLKRLCEGLVDSQIQELQLSGRYTDAHPAIQAAKISREAIRQQLGTELKVARVALETEIKVSEQRIKLLDEQVKQSQNRIAELADIRADYANVLGEVRNRSTIIEQIEKDLAVAEANRRAAGESSLVTRIDAPVLSDKPIGPGTKTILLAAMMAGFLSGIGLILLLAPIDLGIKHGRRWSDHIYAANQAMARGTETQTTTSQVATDPSLASASATPATTLAIPTQLSATIESTLEHAQAAIQKVKSAVDRRDAPRSGATATTPSAAVMAKATATTPPSEFVSCVSDPDSRPSELATEIQPHAALVRAVQVANLGGGPIKLENPTKLTDTTPVAAKAQVNSQAQAHSETSSNITSKSLRPSVTSEVAVDVPNASDRRTRPRQPPAAIFSGTTDGSNFGFADSSKIAT
jgi:polysaccharide biosynthesis transport protein